jgi:hypothetical protein
MRPTRVLLAAAVGATTVTSAVIAAGLAMALPSGSDEPTTTSVTEPTTTSVTEPPTSTAEATTTVAESPTTVTAPPSTVPSSTSESPTTTESSTTSESPTTTSESPTTPSEPRGHYAGNATVSFTTTCRQVVRPDRNDNSWVWQTSVVITVTARTRMPNGVLFWVDIDRLMAWLGNDSTLHVFPVRVENLTWPLAAGESVNWEYAAAPGAEIAVDVYDESRGRDHDDHYQITLLNCDTDTTVSSEPAPTDADPPVDAASADIPFDATLGIPATLPSIEFFW